MIVHVANPIYDSVFKFMMEDERVAKTILSALLKKEVLAVTIRPHEYSKKRGSTPRHYVFDSTSEHNTTRNVISNPTHAKAMLIL